MLFAWKTKCKKVKTLTHACQRPDHILRFITISDSPCRLTALGFDCIWFTHYAPRTTRNSNAYDNTQSESVINSEYFHDTMKRWKVFCSPTFISETIFSLAAFAVPRSHYSHIQFGKQIKRKNENYRQVYITWYIALAIRISVRRTNERNM